MAEKAETPLTQPRHTDCLRPRRAEASSYMPPNTVFPEKSAPPHAVFPLPYALLLNGWKMIGTEELVERCKRGESRAQALLYERYAPRLREVARRYVADPALADDVVHDGFIVILTHIGGLREAASLAGWMERIVRNLALAALRRERARSSVPLEEADEPADDPGAEEAASLPALAELLALIDRLPTGYAQVFRLSVLEGLSHKEVAERLHIAPHSSSSQLLRARRLLMKMLRERGLRCLLLLLALLGGQQGWRRQHFRIPVPDGGTTKPQLSVISPHATHSPAPALRHATAANAPRRPEADTTGCAATLPETASAHPDSAALRPDSLPDTPRRHLPEGRPHRRSSEPDAESWPWERKGNPWTWTAEYAGGPKREARCSADLLQAGIGSGLPATPPDTESPTLPPVPASIRTWEELSEYLAGNAAAGFVSPEADFLMRIAAKNTGEIVEHVRHYPPFSFGLNAARDVGDRWQLGGGLRYTRLTSDFRAGEAAYVLTRQRLHYAGLSLSAACRLWGDPQLRYSVHATAGIGLDIPVAATLRTTYATDSLHSLSTREAVSAPWQWSVEAGLRFEYDFTPRVGLYVAPSLRYYPDSGGQLRTPRKEQPWQFTLPVGIRFRF